MKRTIILVAVILLASVLAYADDVTGTWNLQGTGSGGPQVLVLTSVNGRTVTGTIDGTQISGGGYKNTEFWFTASRGGTHYQYKGTLNGTTMVLHETAGSQNHTYNYVRGGA